MPACPPQAPAPQAPLQSAAMRPAAVQTAYQHSDQVYDKGARRGGAWRVLFFIALAVLVCAGSALGYIAYTYWNGQHEYDEVAEGTFAVGDADTSGMHTLASFDVDWDALRAVNPDVVGWVYVPGTVISYPICWRENDSTYYLNHNFGRNSAGSFGAEYGCIMLEGVNSPDWTDQVNVIYGHHMLNGSMFALLADFKDDSALFNQHRTFYVLTPEGNFRMTSFAVDRVIGSSTDIVIPNFDTKQEFYEYVKARMDESVVTPDPPGPRPGQVEQVFAFSTCDAPDDRYRVVTFCSVDEFLPAGSSVPRDTSLVDESDIASVGEAVGERTS